ncbi:transposase [Methylomonas paludis]|uniref:transposase n=1 Tax=Methylomonas paludis TaxID=1173101 RepID=UPI002484B9E5|nr:transposase [Methylomonas paludis]
MEYPAEELASLYQSRWQIETTFNEMKTTLKGADRVLRSKTPELVKQEFWGLLLAHHIVRKVILETALVHEQEPDYLSFKNSLSIIRRKLPHSGAFPPNQFQDWWSKMIEQVASGLITSCRGRSNPRCVKRRTKQHLPRQRNEALNQCYNWKIEIVK